MMFPWRGRAWGTTTWKRTSPSAARARIRSSRFLPPIVSLARTRTLWGTLGLLLVLGHGGARGLLRPRLLGRPEDAVHRVRHAVLVRSADHRRHRIEVEDPRRRGHLPLQRERAPRGGGGARAAAPGRDHVVDEHERREPEHERAERDEQIPAGELL